MLVDGRHGPKDNDLTVMNELDKAAVSYQVVLTKADKPLRPELDKVIAATRAAIAKRPAAHPHVILTSSVKGSGLARPAGRDRAAAGKLGLAAKSMIQLVSQLAPTSLEKAWLQSGCPSRMVTTPGRKRTS